MIQLIHNFWPSALPWQLLLGTFGLYLLSIGLFARWYYALYRSDQQNFFFISDIAQRQSETAIAKNERDMATLSGEIEAMEHARKAALAGEISSSRSVLPNGRVVEMDTYTLTSGWGETQDRLCLTVLDASGRVLCKVEGPQDENLDQEYLIRWLDEMLVVWNSRIGTERKRLVEMRIDPKQAWHFFDFLYFSTITQTTVGYGDILPNSKVVRKLVISQIIFGYGLLVVILNMILAG